MLKNLKVYMKNRINNLNGNLKNIGKIIKRTNYY